MSIFRTTHPRDTFAVNLPDGTSVVIDYDGAAVPDAYDQYVREQAASVAVRLLQGGTTTGGSPQADLVRRVADLEALLLGRPVALAELPVRTPSTLNPLVRTGQLVPVDTTTGPVTLTLEPGGTYSRVGVRLDAGTNALTVAGSGSDVVPALGLTRPGTVVVLEGLAGGGGWRPVSRYTPDAAVQWSEIGGRPTIPTQFSQLSGGVPDSAIPSAITRDAELEDVRAALAATDAGLRSDVTSNAGRIGALEPPTDGGVAVYQQASSTQSIPALANVRMSMPQALRTTSLVTRSAIDAGHAFVLNRSGLWAATLTGQFTNSATGNKRFHMQAENSGLPPVMAAGSAGSAAATGAAIGGCSVTTVLPAGTQINVWAYSSSADSLVSASSVLWLAYLGPNR